MTRRLMHMTGIALRPGPILRLISHTGHDMDVDGLCTFQLGDFGLTCPRNDATNSCGTPGGRAFGPGLIKS